MTPDEDPGLPSEQLEAMMTLAKAVRVYHEALEAEGFTPAQALALTLGWQAAMLTAVAVPS